MTVNKYLVIGCYLFSMTMTAHAIDEDKHVLVTERSVKAFNKCLEYINKSEHKLSMSEGDTISEYTKREDTTRLIDRLSNWHFHDEFHGKDKALKSTLLFINTSLHDIFNSRVKALSYVGEKDPSIDFDYDVYLNETKEQISGRVIHYIQDVGVPAHVSPIYHSEPQAPWQKCFVDNDPDPFDGLFTPKNIDAINTKEIDEKTCNNLYTKSKQSSMSLLKVLDDAAKKTRENVRSPTASAISELKDKTWEEAFWPIRTAKNTYDLDDYAHPKKGHLGFLKPHEPAFALPKVKGDEKDNAYWDFFKQQYILIRDNTVLALMIIYLK